MVWRAFLLQVGSGSGQMWSRSWPGKLKTFFGRNVRLKKVFSFSLRPMKFVV